MIFLKLGTDEYINVGKIDTVKSIDVPDYKASIRIGKRRLPSVLTAEEVLSRIENASDEPFEPFVSELGQDVTPPDNLAL